MNRALQFLAPVALIVVLLAGWEIAVRALAVPAYFLPGPAAIGKALATDLPALLKSAWNTLAMALMALVVASLLAQALAFTVALSPVLERAVRPLAVVLQVTPVVALAPLVLIWAGLDHPGRAIIALAAVVAFFPIFSGALTGLKAPIRTLSASSTSMARAACNASSACACLPPCPSCSRATRSPRAWR